MTQKPLSRINGKIDDVKVRAKKIKNTLQKDKDDPEAQAAAVRMDNIAGGWFTPSTIKNIPASVIKTLNDTADAFDAAERAINVKAEEFLKYVKRTTNYVSYEEMAADVAEYLERMGAENLTLLAYYEELGLSKYVRIDDDGTRHYNKEAIRELLTRQNAKDVSKEEYAALILLLDTMNTKDPQGNIVPDLELLELLIDCGYTGTVNNSGGYTYTPTPAFKTLCALYELHVDLRIQENPALLYNKNPENALERQTLLSDMIKAALLSEMVSTHPTVHVPETDPVVTIQAQLHPDQVSPPSMTEALGTKIWDDIVRKRFGLGQGEDVIVAYEHSFQNYQEWLNQHEIDTVRSMYRDKETELLTALGESYVGEILGMAAGGYSILVTVATTGFSLANINCEVDEVDGAVNKTEKNIMQRRVLQAMQAGVIVTTHNGTLTVHGVCINERELQIAVNFFSDDSTEPLDIATLEKEFYEMGATGKESELVKRYVNWYMRHKDEIDGYRVSLGETLDEYRDQHGDCMYKKLEDLPPTLIIELGKKYKDKDYPLNLEVLP